MRREIIITCLLAVTTLLAAAQPIATAQDDQNDAQEYHQEESGLERLIAMLTCQPLWQWLSSLLDDIGRDFLLLTGTC